MIGVLLQLEVLFHHVHGPMDAAFHCRASALYRTTIVLTQEITYRAIDTPLARATLVDLAKCGPLATARREPKYAWGYVWPHVTYTVSHEWQLRDLLMQMQLQSDAGVLQGVTCDAIAFQAARLMPRYAGVTPVVSITRHSDTPASVSEVVAEVLLLTSAINI